jgi:peroxiredoxin
MKPARRVAALFAALAIGAAAFAAWHAASRPQAAPAVRYTLLDGTPSGLEQLRGKVVLVSFWATTCVPCLAEMPRLVATHRKYQSRGYETLAVAMHYDPPALVMRYAEARGLPFGVAIDDTGEIARRFGDVELTPTSVLINRRGEIVKRFVGEPDFAQLHRLVEQLLAEA